MGQSESNRQLHLLDRGLYAMFAQHADGSRHNRARERYRAADLDTGFDLYLARVYGLAWCGGLGVGFVVASTFVVLPQGLLDGAVSFLQEGLPVVNRIAWPVIPHFALALVTAVTVAVLTRWTLIRAGGAYLGWVASARRSDIEATLPGAVRYLRVLASGERDQRAMLRRVADQEAYGETAVAFRRALNRAALTGSLDDGLERVASQTPSRDLLAPFLLKFREHANQSADALEGYLEMEGRLLSHEQSRRQERATGYLELVAELFVVLLVLPALLVLIVTVMGVLSPGLSDPIVTPLGTTTVRGVLVLGSAGFVLGAGATASLLVTTLRPRNASSPTYERPSSLLPLLESITTNPASAIVALAPVGICIAVGLWLLGYRLENVFLLAYAAFGLPVGAVAVRRAKLDDAKDREIQDFVHAVSGHVSLGRPFADAVERVAT